MVHASRGQPGHHRHDELLKSKCLSIISEHLLGFGPTLASEKLSSMFDLNIPVETVHSSSLDETTYEGRKLNYSIFDKLSQINQREVVENKS